MRAVAVAAGPSLALREIADRPASFDEAVALLAAGRVPAEELISSRRPLAEAAACFTELGDPATRELKVLLEPQR